HDPPIFIHDLFEDFKDGTKLIALIEVLSGESIIKLVNIRPADIVDGKSIILGLVWMLILCYQIEESGNEDGSTAPSGTRGRAKEVLLEWARKKTTG
ncbi:unnamed protein product, partial [Didymodactylos carnosus]